MLVDSALRTSDADIFAVGDIASAQHPLFGTRIRTEHWANALKQPAVAVAGMLGKPAEYAELPYFFTDQYDLGMEYVGHAPSYHRVVFRGDVDGREFVAFWLDGDNRVLAGMNVNVWDVLDDVKSLIRSRSPVDPDKLADPQQTLGLLTQDWQCRRCTLHLRARDVFTTVSSASATLVIAASVRDPSGCGPRGTPSQADPLRSNGVVQASTVPMPLHSTCAIPVGSASTAVWTLPNGIVPGWFGAVDTEAAPGEAAAVGGDQTTLTRGSPESFGHRRSNALRSCSPDRRRRSGLR